MSLAFTSARCGACVLLVASAYAQSFNVDFGADFGPPADTYSAAGLPGYWNEWSGGDSGPFELSDLSGTLRKVAYYQSLPFGQASLDSDGTPPGDATALLDDYFDLHSVPAQHWVTGLAPGHYTLLVYSLAPDDDRFRTSVSAAPDPDDNAVLVGGAWPGGLIEGITHARFEIDLGRGQALVFYTFGLPKGTLNGFQLIASNLFCGADFNGDEALTTADLIAFLAAHRAGDPAADFDGDADADDLRAFRSAFSDCGPRRFWPDPGRAVGLP